MPNTLPSTRKQLAQLVDHTLLKPEATTADVDALIDEAVALGAWSVCVSPTFVAHAKQHAVQHATQHAVPHATQHAAQHATQQAVQHATQPTTVPLKICTVVGFPSGKVKSEIKAAEAAAAVKDGADEVDMVIDIGKAKEHDFAAIESDIRAVRAAIPNTLLKVIIESAALTDGEIVGASQAAKNAHADFVKTSTGFHPTGGATPKAVALMRQTVGPEMGVKASGGVRTLADEKNVIEAGATRLGLSGTKTVLAGYDGSDDPVTEGSAEY